MLVRTFFAFVVLVSGIASTRTDYFTPMLRLSGVGVDRERIAEEVLQRRTELMIDSQTFGIMRDPQSLAGAQRITGPKLQAIFREAESKSGLPASLIAAMAYLESWGLPKAASPTGPKGIMQITQGTARIMGLRMVYQKRYRTVTQRRAVRVKGKRVYRTYKRRVPYTVLVRDERLIPEKAIPAAAMYLSRLEKKFGGLDWAIFAYHCGEGCVSRFLSIVRDSEGLAGNPPEYARAFFSASPAHNRRLYESIREHMDRDYSPTYWFRIMRAQQLLELYKKDRKAFESLREEYRNRFDATQRAPHRLSVWITPEEVNYLNCDDIRRDVGTRLVRAMEDSDFYGFRLRKTGPGALGDGDLEHQEFYLQASPAVLGTLVYIAFETRRLHAAMRPRGETFVPLEVTGLVRPADHGRNGDKFDPHCTGQVFSISYANLPGGQREALDFVLNDMGWMGYLGFVRDWSDRETMQIGCSPSSRDFFTRIYEEARREQPGVAIAATLTEDSIANF